VLYRDMRTQGHNMEEMYREARGAGVVFLKYPAGRMPEVLGDNQSANQVRFHENLLNEDMDIEADAVVLSVALRPNDAEFQRFREMLKIPRSPDGFMMERHPKLGPVETQTAGIFLAGTLQGPKDTGDAMSQASATAAKAGEIVCRDEIELEATTAAVMEDSCRACGMCVSICEYHAPSLVEVSPGAYVARINEALCKGCGTCAAWCPVQAIHCKHFTDQQIHAMLESMLTEGVG
jgi:heterodisulfide reductase subunit A